MDNADIAQDIIDHRLQQALAHRRLVATQSVRIDRPTNCVDCDEEIPAARRERLPGVTTCVACQTIREGRR